MDYFVLSQIIRYSLIQFVVLYRGLGILPCMGWETPCSMRAMPRLPCPRSRLPCPSFYLPEYTSHSDWLHHNNLTYIVILNYILSSEQQNRPSQQGNAPTPCGCMHAARSVSTTLHGWMLYSSIVDVWKQTFNFPMEMTYP